MALLKKRPGRLKQRASKVKAKLADTASNITQEIYRKNVELARTNQTLSLLRTIDDLVLESKNTPLDLARGITKAIISNSNYQFCMLFMHLRHNSSHVMQAGGLSVAGDKPDLLPLQDTLEHIELNINLKWFASKATIELVNIDDQDHLVKSLFTKNQPIIKNLSSSLNSQSFCLIKLEARGKLVGVMLIGLASQTKNLSEEELSYLRRISEAAALALDNKLLFEENQEVLQKLKNSNEKLRALDEAKDEFVSMASHQLRTPLTSIKGYLSMVLEGDSGPISKQQKELLTQAFISSQRMVYLISDLLNVSRLKTGKFVIETKPTYLPDVVEGEIQQLKETAKARNLEVSFIKPKQFPHLNLDEDKTRQVVMNFLDNALYYTPAGGHIKVELSVNGDSAEYRVIDDGLGVPKDVQHHLFTKFYRAENAKKARPDGTGLGLFMAKKVIVAQGGAVIFESEEGKGSTFGFSFPVNKLKTEAPAKV